MEAYRLSLFVAFVILLVGVDTVFGIKCYVCNSGYKYGGEECLNKDSLVKSKFLVDCAVEEEKDHLPNGTYKYCRVFGQTVIDEQFEDDEYRLIRQCASDGRIDRCIERTGTKGIRLSYCHCDTDGCNGSSTLYSSISLLLAAIAAAWIYAQRT